MLPVYQFLRFSLSHPPSGQISQIHHGKIRRRLLAAGQRASARWHKASPVLSRGDTQYSKGTPNCQAVRNRHARLLHSRSSRTQRGNLHLDHREIPSSLALGMTREPDPTFPPKTIRYHSDLKCYGRRCARKERTHGEDQSTYQRGATSTAFTKPGHPIR